MREVIYKALAVKDPGKSRMRRTEGYFLRGGRAEGCCCGNSAGGRTRGADGTEGSKDDSRALICGHGDPLWL